MGSSGVYFNSDIILEILSRASLQAMSECRLLSKETNDLTYQSNFTNLHSQRTNTIRGYFVQNMYRNHFYSTFVSCDGSRQNPLSLKFLSPYDRTCAKITASTKQGLMLLVNSFATRDRYIVCKPGIGLCRLIPNPKTRYFSFTQHMGMSVLKSNPLHFKIVRFSTPNNGNRAYLYSYRCEVFDSNDWSWKQKESISLPKDMFLEFNHPVSACGALHWFASRQHVFAYYMDVETWELIDFPNSICEDHLRLIDYEGKLGFICIDRDQCHTQLWILTDHKHKIWTLSRSISLKPPRRQEPCSYVEAFCNSDVAIMKSFYDLTFYRFTDENSKQVKLNIDSHEIFSFESDLESDQFDQQNLKRKNTSRSSKSDNEVSSNSSIFIVLLFLFYFVMLYIF